MSLQDKIYNSIVLLLETEYFNKMRKDNVTLLKIK